MKKTVLFLIFSFFAVILFSNVSYARFADEKYPPDSSGYADLTEEEAQDIYENQIKQQNTTAEDFINKSGNNYLKSLTVEDATLSPEFERQNERYNVTLNNPEANKIIINAEAEDSTAKIEGTGERELTDGINNIRVTVTAENGNVKFYDLTIQKPYKQSNLRLNSLEIEGVRENKKNKNVELNPKFDKEVFEYSVDVTYDVTSLQINAKADENIDVTINGGDPLEVGENIVTIELSSMENDTQKTTYVLKVNKKEKSNYSYLIIIVIIILLILLILLLKKAKKKNRKTRPRH